MTWHATLNVPTQIVEPGLTTDLTWDGSGRLTQVKQTDTTSQSVPYSTNGRTRTWTYTYGLGGLLAALDGPMAGTGDTTSYTYNPQGFLKTVTNEVGQVITVTTWNGMGQPTSVTDPNGLVTNYTYDPLGQLSGVVVDPSGGAATWSMTYTAVGDLATLTEPLGATYTLTWDDARRLKKIQNNPGESVTYTYNALSNPTSTIVKAANGTTQTFKLNQTLDELGRVIQQTDGATRTWKRAYDRTDNLTSVTDPRLKTLGFGFDAVNRLISETERDGGVVSHGYNGKDEETTYTDPRNLATGYVRNGFGEVIQESSPDRGASVYDYDTRGLMISKKDARNVTVTYTYDNAGRLTKRTYPTAALNETFTYDGTAGGNAGKGRLTRMTDAAGTSDYTYDLQGRLVKEVRTIGTYAHTVGYTYDGPGRLTKITYPSGRTVLYGYDTLGRRKSVALKRTAGSAQEAIASNGAYLPFGGLRDLDFGNGLSLRTTWGLDYRLNKLSLYPSAGGASLIERTHPIGDGLNLTKLNNDAIDASQTQSFGYDDAGRLLTASGPYGSRTYSYDKVGNRLSEAKTVSGTTTTDSYSYPASSNRLASILRGGTTMRAFVYNAAGSQTSDTRSGTAYATPINNAGRISQVSVGGTVKASYTYDGRNRLAVRQTLNMTPSGTSHMIHDAWDRVIVETDGAGGAVREYMWLDDLPVAVLDGSATPANPTLLWVHADHLNRPELLTDATRAIKWKAVYEPFGSVASITGAAALQMRFPGQWFQLEAGLAYNWWRHYDSSTGRYTQADPLGINQGPLPPGLGANPMPNAAPGTTLLPVLASTRTVTPNVAGARVDNPGGVSNGGLHSGLAGLLRFRQQSLGIATNTDYAATAGADDHGHRVRRDEPNLYGYARQSAVVRTDRNGLVAGAQISPSSKNDLVKQCLKPGGTDECKLKIEVPYGVGAYCFYDCAELGFYNTYRPIGGCPDYLDVID